MSWEDYEDLKQIITEAEYLRLKSKENLSRSDKYQMYRYEQIYGKSTKVVGICDLCNGEVAVPLSRPLTRAECTQCGALEEQKRLPKISMVPKNSYNSGPVYPWNRKK